MIPKVSKLFLAFTLEMMRSTVTFDTVFPLLFLYILQIRRGGRSLRMVRERCIANKISRLN
jgi:hypothetical protein